MADITPQERFRGCLLAGAAGDALGAPVEFMSRADILRHFSAAGITAFAPGYERVGAITDDTQMTLFTAAGLLAAWCGDGDVVRATARSYLTWLRTQDEWPYDPLLAAEEPSGWLWQQPELHHSPRCGLFLWASAVRGRVLKVRECRFVWCAKARLMVGNQRGKRISTRRPCAWFLASCRLSVAPCLSHRLLTMARPRPVPSSSLPSWR